MNQPTSIDDIISRLRPRSLGEVLDHAFRLYRKHFLTFLAMTAVVYIPVNMVVQVASAYLQGSALAFDSEIASISRQELNERLITLLLSLGVVLALALLANLVLYVSQGALTSAVADSYLDKPVSFARGYGEMWKRRGPLLGSILIQILVIVGLFLPAGLLYTFALLSGVTDESTSGGFVGLICLTFVALIPAFVYYFYLYIRWSLVAPAIMVEDLGAREGLRRSAQLVQGYWWRTLGLVLLLALLSSIIAGGPATIITLIFLAVFRTFDPILLGVISGVVTVLIATIFVPLQLISITLYYFDLRVRKEGFDLEAAMAQRYWPQYGGYGQYGQTFGEPPLGWATGEGQYAPADGGAGGSQGISPPVLGEASTQSSGYQHGYGYDYQPPEEPSGEASASHDEPGESDDMGGVPTKRVTADVADDAGTSGGEVSQATSPTPDWLKPPVLGARQESEPGKDKQPDPGSKDSRTAKEQAEE